MASKKEEERERVVKIKRYSEAILLMSRNKELRALAIETLKACDEFLREEEKK